ncbi:transcriptional regulator [Kitasatospora sp. MMS16-BH015]|uniref:MerR family transcriptional regulator n=1 Tax=Kitasatospora sp. MMS16-BH015 TaxID=2018025 RepID=UPI000CA33579|nr:MerR family transcriptional regulator [Kitasatospora sp. MMS16-BH015]AUG78953.1 transcriptional regulator [Kitasatospora sp. MMS16-BH015]
MSTAVEMADEGSVTMALTSFSPRERTYSITEVERISGLAAHTLRWYEQLGLIDGVQRGPGGKRVYTARHLNWLEFLSGVRETGMSVADMTRYVALAREGDRTIPLRRQMVEEHRALIRRRSDELACILRQLDQKIDTYRQFEEAAAVEAV